MNPGVLELLALLSVCYACECAAGTMPASAASAAAACVVGVGLACASILGRKRKRDDTDSSQQANSGAEASSGEASAPDQAATSDGLMFTMPHNGTNARSSITLISVLVLMLHVSTWG